MALFKSDQNIVDALKQELAPFGAEMKNGIKEIQSSIKDLCERVEALEKENVKLHASVALKKNQLEEEADTKASQKAAEMVAGRKTAKKTPLSWSSTQLFPERNRGSFMLLIRMSWQNFASNQ